MFKMAFNFNVLDHQQIGSMVSYVLPAYEKLIMRYVAQWGPAFGWMGSFTGSVTNGPSLSVCLGQEMIFKAHVPRAGLECKLAQSTLDQSMRVVGIFFNSLYPLSSKEKHYEGPVTAIEIRLMEMVKLSKLNYELNGISFG